MITILAWSLLVFSAAKVAANLAGLCIKDNVGRPCAEILTDATVGAGGPPWLVVAVVVHAAFLLLAALVLLGD